MYKYEKTKSGEANEAIAGIYMVFYSVPDFRYSLRLAPEGAAILKLMGLE